MPLRTTRALALLLALAAPLPAQQPEYDLLITGGTVVDGSGGAGYTADVAVRDGRIARIAREPLPASAAARVIDASGMVVAPGFIDVHAHLDPLLRMPDAESHVRQGVTTALGGPDGGSPWPLGEHLDSAQTLGLGMNVAFLVGHNTIRREVMGLVDRAPTAAELERMRGMVARAMTEGAWGLSTGLKYLPGAYSNVDEVVALAEVAADSGGIYTSHLREEGLGLIDAVAEAIEIGRRARIPVVLTHHKAVGQPMWGASERTLAMIDSARAAGVDVMADQYPYTATYTGIGVLIPAWARADGDTAFRRRLADPLLRDSILGGIVFNILNDRGGGDLRRIQLARAPWQPELEGKTLADWARMRGLEPTPQVGAELVIEAELAGETSAIYHVLDESDVERIMRHPQTMIASDGRLVRPGDGHPHPRWYGTFPRVLGHYVREKGVLELEDAVRKMSGLPAARLGLERRGLLREGYAADVVVFDPETVIDRATFEDPHQYPEGIEWVVVNGEVVVDGGRFTEARPGQVLRRPAGRARAAGVQTQLESTLEIIDIASTARRVVHRVRGHLEAPNWSPDGSYLLYNSDGRIHTIPVGGGEPRRLDTGFAVRANNDHGISPDGRLLVISDQSGEDNQSRIYTLPIEGGTPSLVTPRGPSYWHGWSPDGRTLAFVGLRDGDYDIYTVPVGGGEETRLTTAPGLDDGPDYAPDGRTIYFNSVRTGTMQIWRMAADGSNQEQLTFDDYNDWFPHPSPDGRWLVFLSYEPGVDGHPPNHHVMLRLMPAAGGEVRVLAKLFGGQGTINVPSWSPDSREVAFVSYRFIAAASP